MASPFQPASDLRLSPPPLPSNITPCPSKSDAKTKPECYDLTSIGESILSFVIQAIVIAIAIPLFFLLTFVAAIILLHLWLAGAALGRHRTPNSHPNRSPIHVPNPLDLTPTLSRAQLRRMPCFMWRWPWPKEQCCAVCLEKVQRGELYRSLPACAHVFHKACVDKWLLKCPKCPLCREVVRPV